MTYVEQLDNLLTTIYTGFIELLRENGDSIKLYRSEYFITDKGYDSKLVFCKRFTIYEDDSIYIFDGTENYPITDFDNYDMAKMYDLAIAATKKEEV